jgi:hypothetical protein
MRYNLERAITNEFQKIEFKLKEAKEDGIVEGEAKGKVLMAQDSICQYLEARLGVESQVLQDSVYTITDLDMLTRIMKRILIGSPEDEIMALIRDNCVSQ